MTMNKKQSKRQRDIKTKLMAAICMLLVSSIMMVSTTYAWFTLSTAPEVTGISTAVGANGNLEMALQPLNGDSNAIQSNVGDSVKAAIIKNTTWGNLVDVSDVNTYGMNNITLYPAALNTEETANGLAIAQNPLATPSYGADGRIAELEKKKTITGVYNPDGKFLEGFTGTLGDQTVDLTSAYGVRAIGVSSGMSDRQLAFRAALTAANNAASQAKRVASQALNANGAALADLAIKHATATGVETYSKADLIPMQTIVNVLLGTDPDAVDGAMEYIAEALKQYALAVALNKAGDDTFAGVQTAFEGATLDTLASVMSANEVTIDGYTGDTGYIKVLQNSIAKVATAKSTIDGLLNGSEESFEWDDFSSAVTELANPTAMQVNKIPVGELKGNWKYDAENDGPLPSGYSTNEEGYVLDDEQAIVSNMARLVDSVLADGGIQLIIRSGAGVFADISDFCGDYSAAITLSKIEYGGMTVKNLDATMSTKTRQSTPYLTVAQNSVGTFQAGQGGSSSAAISDFYGYILDLAFRTNVAGSNLQLQAEAMDRIYSDSSNEATMGHGANMTFTPAPGFTVNQVKSLMDCIRIVFFNTDNKVIIGHARLDTANAEMDNTTGSITANLFMTDDKGVAKTTADGKADPAIMALEQNTVHELSVMVYLDGEKVTNADVANGVSSMTGKMNLQFSSSATLVPMDYTALKEGTGETPAAPSYTATDVTKGSITSGYTIKTLKHVTDGASTAALVAEITTTDGAAVEGTGYKVTIGGEAASYQTYGTYSGWAVSSDTTAPTGAVDVTVEVVAAG